MPLDPATQKIVDTYLNDPVARKKLAESMIAPLMAKRHELSECDECGMPMTGIMSRMLHSDEECLLYFVMES